MSGPLILPNGLQPKKANPFKLVTAAEDKAAPKPRPINPLYKVALQALLQGNEELKRLGLVLDMGMNKEEGRKRLDLGVFKTTIDGWTLTVNWTTKKQQSLPAHYMAIEFGGQTVAILSPYLTGRACWHCDYPDLDAGDSCPRCKERDWRSRIVGWRDCHQALTNFIALRTGRDELWAAMGGAENDRLLGEAKKRGKAPAGALFDN